MMKSITILILEEYYLSFLLEDDFIFTKDIQEHDESFGELDSELWIWHLIVRE